MTIGGSGPHAYRILSGFFQNFVVINPYTTGPRLNFNICSTFIFTWSSQAIFAEAEITCSLKENKIKKPNVEWERKISQLPFFFLFQK